MNIIIFSLCCNRDHLLFAGLLRILLNTENLQNVFVRLEKNNVRCNIFRFIQTLRSERGQ